MNNFDFSDEETKVEDAIRNSNGTNIVLSPSSRSSPNTNKKKRFRLNYGSSKLICRKEINHDVDEVDGFDKVQEKIECASDSQSLSTSKASEKPVPRRRKKRNLVGLKEKKIKDDIFSKASPETFRSSPSSFLSSVRTNFSLSSGSILASNDTKNSNDDTFDGEEQIAIQRNETHDAFFSPSNPRANEQSPSRSPEMENPPTVNLSSSPQSSHAPSSIISYQSESVVATRAGTDTFAAQDAGTFRMVLDDFMYYCSSFFSSVDDYGRIVKGNIASDSVCDLAVMLSSKKTRSILMTFGGNDDKRDDTDSGGEVSAFKSILNVISLSMYPYRDSPQLKEEFKLVSRDIDCCVGKENSPIAFSDIIRQDNHEPEHDGLNFITSKIRTKSSRQQKPGNSSSSQVKHDLIISRAMALIVHFLSFDCLSSKDNSIFGSNPAAAKQFRRRLLQEKSSLQGISRLLLDDFLVSSILNHRTTMHDENCDVRVPKCDTHVVDSSDFAATSSKDPTKSGRRKRKQKKSSSDNMLESINEHTSLDGQEDAKTISGFDFTSDGTSSIGSSVKSLNNFHCIPTKFRLKLGSVEAKTVSRHSYIHGSVQSHICTRCSAGSDSITKCNPGYLSLEAFSRILCGKKENNDGDLSSENESDVDINVSSETCESENQDIEDDELSVGKELSNHPLMHRNRMVQESGSLPFLNLAICETFEASVQLHSSGDTCDRCCQYIRDRVHALATIINDICLLCDDNRTIICRISTDGNVPMLITSLMKAVYNLVIPYPKGQANEHIFCDIGLSALRLLTSLTHENDVAGFQLCQQYRFLNSSVPLDSYICGVDLIFILLHRLACDERQNRNVGCNSDSGIMSKAGAQHIYDSIIFCLNTLTNTLETTSSFNMCKGLVSLELSNMNDITNKKSENALSWLSSWVVDQTLPFRDAVMDAILPTTKVSRGLKSSEDEYLLTAGNGFVLLACFLREDVFMSCDNPGKDITTKVRKLIMENIPTNEEGKLVLAINTLKAFCNFYRYSIGELSVAVVDPVLKLVTVLENVDNAS